MPGRSTYKTINKAIGQAHHQYHMIADGDNICVGVSGGKDSLTLLWFLQERLRRIPIHYNLYPCYIDPGFENSFHYQLGRFCRENNWDIRIEHTDYGIYAHSEKNLENPCFLCARLRRKRLFEISAELGCNKLALGHNKDDIIESLFLNMCYSGEISTMKPFMPMFDGEITIIRPLAFVEEKHTRRFAQIHNFPEFINLCPSAEKSQRKTIKNFLAQLYQNNKSIKGNIFRSLRNVKTDYLL